MSASSPRSSGTLRIRLQHSLSTSFTKVGDGFRKRSDSSFGPNSTSPGSPKGTSSVVPEAVELICIEAAFEKLFHPEGCEERFENVFLGMHHYFLPWALFLEHFKERSDALSSLEPSERALRVTRLIQVATKWLRLNPRLRSERVSIVQMEADATAFKSLSTLNSVSSSGVSSSAESPRSVIASSLRSSVSQIPSSPRSPESPRASMQSSGDSHHGQLIEVFSGSEDDDDDDDDDEPVVLANADLSYIDAEEETRIVAPPSVSPPSLPPKPIKSSASRGTLTMGTRRSSLYLDASKVTGSVTAINVKMEDLDKHLGATGGSDSSDVAPLSGRDSSRETAVHFVISMDEWIRTLSDEFTVLTKYWDSWRFPKRTRGTRHDSVYYRGLQKVRGGAARSGRADGDDEHSESSASVLDFEAEKLGKQLCFQELNTFKCISRKEMCQRNFLEADTGPNFQYMVSQFNVWCSWVCDAVLQPNDAVDRALVIGQFIEIAHFCHSNNNFNTSYAIVAGLTHPQVARLRRSWDAVSPATMKLYDALMEAWDVSGNYRRYRDVLKTVAPPCVPYLGLLGKDLFSMEENAKTLVKGPDSRMLINFKKLSLLWSTISFVDNIQLYEYADWTENKECATFLASVRPILDEKALKARSHSIEPRESVA